MRLFLAIPVPLHVAAVTAPLIGPDFRPVPEGSAHVTVRFLGEADVEDVAAALDGFKASPMEARFTNSGAFPGPRRARVAWLGVEAEGLPDMADDVRRRVEDIGQSDGKDFVPHVTLGRCKRPLDLRAPLSDVQVPRESFQLDRVDLVASELTPQGPVHSVVRTWAFD